MKRLLCVIGLVLSANLADAALTTNSWQVNSGKWEIGINWDHGVPTLLNTIDFLDKTIPVGTTRTITIDQVTVLSNALNSCLTISNLTLSGTSMSLQLLVMTNAALTTPLTIVNNLTINAHTFVTISNAALRVGTTGVGSISVDGGLTLSAGMLISTNNSSSFAIGNTGAGAMTVLGGTWQGSEVFVGNLAGSHGTLTVAGGTNTMFSFLDVGEKSGSAGAVWMTGGLLMITNFTIIGNGGVGQMTVSNGTWRADYVALGSSPGAKGTLTIAGGTNSISAGIFISQISTVSTGVVWVTDGQLTVTNAETDVGSEGVGQMTVSNGTWRAEMVIVGDNSGSQGTLTVAGGTNTLSGRLAVGYGSGSTGTVWLTGGQLMVTNDFTFVGYDGDGQMTVSNGIWRANELDLGMNSGSQGTLTVAGGTNTVLSVFGVGSGPGTTGTLWLTSGQLVTANNAQIGYAGMGRMTVSNGTWQAQVVQVGVTPGSQGTLTVNGGTSTVFSSLIIGDSPCSATGAVVIAGGSLFVTNSTASAVLEVRSGTLTLSSGVLVVDTLVITNACAHFIHSGGTLIMNNPPVLDPAGDVDGDGIPNGYELAHDLDPFNPADASFDNDGDGQNNLAEFLAGTDPNNSASGLRILSLVRQDPDMRITWTGGGGTNYVVQAANGGAGGSFTSNFSTLSTISLSGVGNKTNTYVDAFGATNSPARYYRVRLAP